MKKSGYIVALLIEIILYTGAYVFNYFTVRRLGMNRYVVYLNGQIKEAVPIEMILKVGLPVLLIFCILTIIIYVRNKNDLKKLSVFMVLVSICTTEAPFILPSSVFECEKRHSLIFTDFRWLAAKKVAW